MNDRPFPFSAVVGHDEARLALLLAAMDPQIGGVLLRGAKGSAKSTLARGLATLLPTGAPFVELPIGATEDRVLGSIDVRALLGEASEQHAGATPGFRPGLLAAAHGGVLYVDEVNLLPDELVDGLLDAAASGVNRVERDGVSHEHPASFVLLGSMNPEEGELRPQLLDRFGLAVDVHSPQDPTMRAEAVRRRLAHDAGKSLADTPIEPTDEDLARRLAAAHPAELQESVMLHAARLAVAVGAESLRADLVLCRAAAALAGWDGRAEATNDDIAAVAPLVLGHRRRRRPFEPPTLPSEELEDALNRAGEEVRADGTDHADGDASQTETATDSTAGGGTNSLATQSETRRWQELAGEALHAVPEPPDLLGDPPRPRRITPDGTGRRAGHGVPDAGHDPRGVAVIPTLRTAMFRRAADPNGPELEADDLREPRRLPRQGRTVVLAVDASGSMGTRDRVAAATGAVLGLLADAYLARDQVALVAFCGEDATELLPPTGSVELARSRLADVPTGGATPLAAGITAALATARRAEIKGSVPLLALLTDGRPTGSSDALEQARQAAHAVADAGIPALVLDAEDGHDTQRLGLAGDLAGRMAGRCVHLSALTGSQVEAAVRDALER